MNQLRRHALIGFTMAAALFAGGCATIHGTDFDRGRAQGYQPGITTKEQVLREMGKPRSARLFTINKDLGGNVLDNPTIIEEFTYYYEDTQAPAVAPGISPSRSAWFSFAADRLVAFATRSSFSIDSTNFDESRARQVVSSQTTEADLIRLFGRPTGASVYPSTKERTGYGLNYEIYLFDAATRKGTMKRLTFFLNEAKVVTTFEVSVKTN